MRTQQQLLRQCQLLQLGFMAPTKPTEVWAPEAIQLLASLPQQVLYPHHISLADSPVLLQAVPRIGCDAAAAWLLLLSSLAQYSAVQGQHLPLYA